MMFLYQKENLFVLSGECFWAVGIMFLYQKENSFVLWGKFLSACGIVWDRDCGRMESGGCKFI